ncbi:MAG: hypothetical protein MUO76_09910 [Anaerolineaceae bacterium]|nr:hypothetical protein [Anaerolineaceae bacterium]
MEREIIDKVCSQVYKRFPEVQGMKPKIQSYTSKQSLFIFHGKATAADGHTIPRTVRVVVDNNGKIGKMTTSR